MLSTPILLLLLITIPSKKFQRLNRHILGSRCRNERLRCFMKHQQHASLEPESYTLKIGDTVDVSYMIGPHHILREAERSVRKQSHRLGDALSRHRELDNQISKLETPIKEWYFLPEIRRLKAEKLRCKDIIIHLMNEQSRNDTARQIELGAGGFGKVMFGQCINTKREVAIKLARTDDSSELQREYSVLQRLRHFNGFPQVFYYGQQQVPNRGECAVMVMDVLGPSLEKLLFSTHLGIRGFKPLSVLKLGTQMLDRLATLSNHNIVHGDIQPGNFLLGRTPTDRQKVYLIDFGLSSIKNSSEQLSRYVNTQVESNVQSRVSGTLSFASSRSLRGQTTNSRDDLEALIFTLAYLLRGRLPWSQFEYNIGQAGERELIESIVIQKDVCTANDLCGEFYDLPVGRVIESMLAHTRCLDVNNLPDYVLLKGEMEVALSETVDLASSSKSKSENPMLFDWEEAGITWSAVDGSIDSKWY